MQNTIKQLLPEFKISLTESDTDFMRQLSATMGDFSFVLQVLPNDVIKSTGMIVIPSGIITVDDVGRVLSAAMPPEHNNEVILPASTTCHYMERAKPNICDT